MTREMMMRVYLLCFAFRPGSESPEPPPDEPPPLLLDTQHLKSEGPGHKPVSDDPLHCEVQRQSPLLPPLPHDGLVQHLMSSGVPGQAFEMKLPPESVHLEVAMHTPDLPFAPVHAPLTVEREPRMLALTQLMLRRAKAIREE